jgi:hypothetical protein
MIVAGVPWGTRMGHSFSRENVDGPAVCLPGLIAVAAISLNRGFPVAKIAARRSSIIC